MLVWVIFISTCALSVQKSLFWKLKSRCGWSQIHLDLNLWIIAYFFSQAQHLFFKRYFMDFNWKFFHGLTQNLNQTFYFLQSITWHCHPQKYFQTTSIGVWRIVGLQVFDYIIDDILDSFNFILFISCYENIKFISHFLDQSHKI